MATFTSDPKPSTFRKIAAAMWGAPNDPTMYGYLDADATELQKALERLRSSSGARVTVTHLVARALALCFLKYPECNAKVRWWGKIEMRDAIDLFLQVSTDGGQDLSGTRIEDAGRKSALDLAREIDEKAKRIRNNDDPALKKSRGLFGWLPWFFVRPLLRLCDWLVNELHIDLTSQGMPRDPFGTAMITNIGVFGIDTGFAPFTPIGRCALIVAICELKDRPWVVDKAVVVRPILRLTATFDHRVVDGAHAGKISKEMVRLLENPAEIVAPATPATTPP